MVASPIKKKKEGKEMMQKGGRSLSLTEKRTKSDQPTRDDDEKVRIIISTRLPRVKKKLGRALFYALLSWDKKEGNKKEAGVKACLGRGKDGWSLTSPNLRGVSAGVRKNRRGNRNKGGTRISTLISGNGKPVVRRRKSGTELEHRLLHDGGHESPAVNFKFSEAVGIARKKYFVKCGSDTGGTRMAGVAGWKKKDPSERKFPAG